MASYSSSPSQRISTVFPPFIPARIIFIMLVALNHLWQCGLSMDELAEMGLTLGADVPVFVRGHAAFAEGVGEILTPVDPPEKWYLVAHPGVSIPTPVIFKDPELPRNTPAQ